MLKSLLISIVCLISIQGTKGFELNVTRGIKKYVDDSNVDESYEASHAEYKATIYLGEPL